MRTILVTLRLPTLLALCALGAATLAAGEDPYAQLANYKYGDSRKALTAIEASTRGASQEQLKQIETRLIAVLQAPEATADCKGWICVFLRQVGSEASVAPVAALLADKDVSVRACIALQSLPGPKVDETLREALPKLPAELQPAILQTIGTRGDAKAVSLIAPLTTHADANVAVEALFALGRIGSTEALDALKNAKVAEVLRGPRFQALLVCADHLAATGKKAEAAGVYGSAFKEVGLRGVRIAALRGLALNDKAQAAEALVAALKETDARLRAAALQCLCELADDELTTKALAALGTLDPPLQTVLLESAQTKAVLPTALEALTRENAELRIAAIRAIGRAGGAAEVAALAADASKNAADAAEVQAALGALKDPKADDELLKLLQQPDLKQVRLAVAALNARGARTVFPELMKLAATCTDEGVARELGSALAGLAGAANLNDLVKLLMTTSAPSVRAAATNAIAGISKANGSANTCRLLAAELAQASPDGKAAALGVLAMLGDADALVLVREQLKAAKEPVVQAAAVRCLADWPDAAPVNDLLAIAKETQDLQQNVLALRGILRMLAKPGSRSGAETAALLKQALESAKRDEEKQQINQALARLQSSNIAPKGKASSPDGIEKDGGAGGDQAAIDGNPDTYWDEEDGKGPYILKVDFPSQANVIGLRIMGFEQHNFAPKDFEVLCDGKVVKKVSGATYVNNVLSVELPKTSCRAVELKITGSYGPSPAIRELEIVGAVE